MAPRTTMNFVPSQHQAAGHDGCLTAGPVFAKLTTSQEIAFYAETARQLLHTEPGAHISHWMPTYMGTLHEAAGASQKEYLVILNLYHGVTNPCILDIKLGAVLVDDTVSEEKRKRLESVSQNTTSGSLGFRLCGMKMYDSGPVPSFFPNLDHYVHREVKHRVPEEGSEDGGTTADSTGPTDPPGEFSGYVSFDKNFGKTLTEHNVSSAIEHFFTPLGNLKKHVITRFHQRLQLVYNCLIDTEVRIKSGSLFFIYDACPDKVGALDATSYFESDPLVQEYDDGSEDDVSTLSSLHLIDFAHAVYTPGQGPDENVLDGVENLIRVFGEILEKME